MAKGIGISLLIGGLLSAQAQVQPQRQKIGLVLSGGGALGLSHVGVLEWLEEHRIPVAYVGGTSMGGLVGGLFATGHDAAEMKEFVRSIDWANVLAPSAPFHDLAFRRKEDRRAFPNKLQLGLKNGLQFPSGLSSGHDVGLVLSSFAAPYSEYRSFDDLPTPFRCVATNLINGEQVVFSEGSLPTALRATMSLPAIFSPVEVGDMVLADGGMLNNLPVDVVKKMGADLTLAVTIIDAAVKKESVSSLLGVAKRSIAIMIDDNARRSMAAADMLISPDLTGLTSSDFSKFEEMERRGYEAAEKKKVFLQTLSVSEEEWQRYLAERRRKRLPKQVTPAFVTVSGVEGPQEKGIANDLEAQMKGQPVDEQKLEAKLTEIAGYGPYQSVDYAFVKKNGADGLQVNVHPKSYGPPVLDTGINIEGTTPSLIRFGIGARLTFMDFGAPNSELRADVTLGRTSLIGAEYYRRLAGTRWFVAPRTSYSRRIEDVYDNRTITSQLKVKDLGFGTDVGYAVSRFQEVRAGYVLDYTHPSVSSGVAIPGLSEKAATLNAVRLRWAYDNQDSPIIPHHGIHSVMDLRWTFSNTAGLAQFGVFEEQLTAAKSFGPRYTVVVPLAGGTIVGPRSYILPFALGGPGAMSAFGYGQLRGDRYYYSAVHGLRAFSTDRSSFMSRVYIDLGGELGKAFTDIDFGQPAYDGLLGVVAETPVGIVMFGGSYGTSGNRKIFFRIGRLF